MNQPRSNPLASVDATESSGSKAVKALKGSGCLQSEIMGFPLEREGGWHLSSAKGGLAGEKNLQNVPPPRNENSYPSKFGKFGKLIDSKVPADGIRGYAKPWDPGFGNSSKELNLTGYRSPAAARKAVPSEDNLKHKLRGFQSCSWLVMLIHSGLQGSCHHHLYRRLASKIHLEEN